MNWGLLFSLSSVSDNNMEEDNNNLNLNSINNISNAEEDEGAQSADKMLKLLRGNNFQHLLGVFQHLSRYKITFSLQEIPLPLTQCFCRPNWLLLCNNSSNNKMVHHHQTPSCQPTQISWVTPAFYLHWCQKVWKQQDSVPTPNLTSTTQQSQQHQNPQRFWSQSKRIFQSNPSKVFQVIRMKNCTLIIEWVFQTRG